MREQVLEEWVQEVQAVQWDLKSLVQAQGLCNHTRVYILKDNDQIIIENI